MAMNSNYKQMLYGSSSYGQRQAEKQAIFNNSKYGQAQTAINSLEESSEAKKYVLPDGRVLVRQSSSNRIDFKTLFGSFNDDTDSSNASTLALFNNLKNTSGALLSAYEKQAKQNLGWF